MCEKLIATRTANTVFSATSLPLSPLVLLWVSITVRVNRSSDGNRPMVASVTIVGCLFKFFRRSRRRCVGDAFPSDPTFHVHSVYFVAVKTGRRQSSRRILRVSLQAGSLCYFETGASRPQCLCMRGRDAHFTMRARRDTRMTWWSYALLSAA